MEPLVSVIVPVYKVEKYLDRCIESIVNQTYKNLEIIIVDDGSPDKCPQMCDEWARSDSRITVIHKENGGLSDARNTALDLMTGEYILFVDSDDIIALNAVEILYNVLIQEKSDMVISKNYVSFSNELQSTKTDLFGVETVDSNRALEVMFCETTRWEAWGTLYKRFLFDDLRFPKDRIYEDISTTPKAVLLSSRVSYIDAKIYYYYIRNDSIMRVNNAIIKIDLYDSINEIIPIFNQINDISVRNNVIAGILQELASRVHLASRDKKNNRAFIACSKKLIRKNMGCIFKSDELLIKQKIFILLVSISLSEFIWRE